ncbi:DUF2087 domain-containing protein [Microbacterium sp. ZW T5_56]|uniref:DUF2087 domain-containing protein n=1 Tax=Microbacterium sp. ZW T5_56 TaxID=3378081 RepID=UPI003854BDFB
MSDDSANAWRPILAAMANDAARELFAHVVLHGHTGAVEFLESLSPSRANHVRSALLSAGMVREDSDGQMHVEPAAFTRALRAAATPPARTGIERFLTADGAIATYPANLTERGELLALVARTCMREDEVLSEAELNERLERFSPDVAVLRRYLVDYGELERTRSGSEYARVATML